MALLGDGGSWEDMGVVPDSLSVVCLAWGFSECLLDMEGLAFFRLHFVSLSYIIFSQGIMGSLLFPFLSFLSTRVFLGAQGC